MKRKEVYEDDEDVVYAFRRCMIDEEKNPKRKIESDQGSTKRTMVADSKVSEILSNIITSEFVDGTSIVDGTPIHDGLSTSPFSKLLFKPWLYDYRLLIYIYDFACTEK